MRPKPLSRSSGLPKNSLDDRDIKIIRCRYCGHEIRKTLTWMRSHTKFQCDGCGEEFSLEKKKIRKALDAVAKAIDELRERLPGW
jgi:transcription elongation factor Elf1